MEPNDTSAASAQQVDAAMEDFDKMEAEKQAEEDTLNSASKDMSA